MKEILPDPPAIVANDVASIQGLFEKYAVPTYGRFDLVLTRGEGNYVWDATGRRYLDLGGGIAVNCLGHANPDIVQALAEQSRVLNHVSNLYYNAPQGRLAQKLVHLIGPGKCFFCNSGAEANEGLYKLARRFGDAEGRFEIITMTLSFHGRTLAGIAATGQEKVKAGFGPAVPGFVQVPYNDLKAVEEAISPATVAVLIEGIQGEGGLAQVSAEYLLGLRKLCDDNQLLLLMDEVQAGHFRTGKYQSWQTLLDGVPGGETFLPDGVSMAKSLGGGLPIGAIWIREPYANLLGAGSHGTTFGGNSLVCAVALKIFEVIERDHLMENIQALSAYFKKEFAELAERYPGVISGQRGMGFLLGLELNPQADAFGSSETTASIQFTRQLQREGMLVIPAGPRVVRFLPAYNLSKSEAETAIHILETTIQRFAS